MGGCGCMCVLHTCVSPIRNSKWKPILYVYPIHAYTIYAYIGNTYILRI